MDPVAAARAQCNKHVVKMVVETAQLLCTSHPAGAAPYRPTHSRHPCALWTRTSIENYRWLIAHGQALDEEYTRRYGRHHATKPVLAWLAAHEPQLPSIGLTPFARAIKAPWDVLTASMPVREAYRVYYVGDKARFARWAPRAQAPEWWPYHDPVVVP